MDYDWKYTLTGGQPRILIDSAEDIRHLPELDNKLWTVLSCPVKGLELNDNMLSTLDFNGDGFIHINEVKSAAAFLSRVLSDVEVILTEGDVLPLSALNRNDEDGRRMATLFDENDLTEVTPLVVETMQTRWTEWRDTLVRQHSLHTPDNHPYGEQTAELYDVFQRVERKIDDFFARCAVAHYAENAQDVLDVQASVIEKFSLRELSLDSAELEQLPLARVEPDKPLILDNVNPVWLDRMIVFFQCLTDDHSQLTNEQWKNIKAKMNIYRSWLDDCKNAEQSLMQTNADLADKKRDIDMLWKLSVLRRDFYTLLRNFVTFSDFYEDGHKAIFQAGELFIDQRCCTLCMEVDDIDKSLSQGNDSGMFLMYCRCYSKNLNRSMNIVSVLTAGSLRNIKVGKHALFFDRAGNDYDAIVTHIIDNPISIGQAFYMPYKKFFNFLENQASKLASDKNQKMMDKATNQVAKSTENAEKAVGAADGEKSEMNQKKKEVFDVAKYCGIFAAIGMAIGYIGGFLTKILYGFVALKWWQMPIAIAAVIMMISGPSMIIAWLKLRKRNLAPLLNANGWAINTSLIVNIIFGNSLSQSSNIPKIRLPRKS